MEAPLLEIRDVKKYFPVKKVHGKEITVKAVDSINLKINQGEIVGLVGESGCGKSTLGKSILKLHEITGGQILFHGEDITNYNERQMRPLREKIQIIFQDPYASLNPKKLFNPLWHRWMWRENIRKKKNWKRSGRSSGRSVSVKSILKNIRMKCPVDRDRES